MTAVACLSNLCSQPQGRRSHARVCGRQAALAGNWGGFQDGLPAVWGVWGTLVNQGRRPAGGTTCLACLHQRSPDLQFLDLHHFGFHLGFISSNFLHHLGGFFGSVASLLIISLVSRIDPAPLHQQTQIRWSIR